MHMLVVMLPMVVAVEGIDHNLSPIMGQGTTLTLMSHNSMIGLVRDVVVVIAFLLPLLVELEVGRLHGGMTMVTAGPVGLLGRQEEAQKGTAVQIEEDEVVLLVDLMAINGGGGSTKLFPPAMVDLEEETLAWTDIHRRTHTEAERMVEVVVLRAVVLHLRLMLIGRAFLPAWLQTVSILHHVIVALQHPDSHHLET